MSKELCLHGNCLKVVSARESNVKVLRGSRTADAIQAVSTSSETVLESARCTARLLSAMRPKTIT